MRRLAALLAPALLALALAGCGEDTETPASPQSTATPAGADLQVEVTEAGKPQAFTCGDGCDADALEEALADAKDTMRACTEIYGGPETAQVSGTLGGKPVDVTVTRNDGCGIADYEAIFDALGVKPPIG